MQTPGQLSDLRKISDSQYSVMNRHNGKLPGKGRTAEHGEMSTEL